MRKEQFNKRSSCRFKQFNRHGYSLFAALGKEVLIGVLSVSTLSYAKADGISIRPDLGEDTLSHQEVKLDEVVVTGSRAPLTALQSAKIVTVISRDDIHRAAVETVNDVLKLATGVDVRQRGGFGVQTDISLNGGTHDQLTILLNGVNISNPQTGHNASDFPVSIDDIERIEVLEGAAARVYGSNAFSGAINIVTRKDVDQHQLTARLESGSFGTVGTEGSYEWGKSMVGHALVSGGYTRSDGGSANSDFEKGRMYLNGQMNLLPNLSMNGQMGWSLQSYGANTFYSSLFPDQYEKTMHLMGSYGLTWRNVVKGLELSPTVYYNQFKDHYQLTRDMAGAAAGENYHDLDIYGLTLNALLEWSLGKTSLGADYNTERLWSTAYGEEQPEASWKAISGSDRQYSRLGKRQNTNLFLEHNVVLRQWTFSAGVLANRNTGLDNDFRFSPGVDIAYRPNIHWKLIASWNQAIRIPTYTDLYTNNKAQYGDVNLKPEHNSTLKMGASFRTLGIETVANTFYSHGTDMIDWVYETAESTRYHALNIGKLDNLGYSMDVTFHLPELVSPAFFITQVKLGYAYIYQTHETNQPIFKSLYALEYLKHKFTAQLDHRIWNRLSAHWALRWQQRMNGYTPYFKLDGKLQWDANRYQLYVKADYITNHRYVDVGGVLQPGIWVMAGGSIKLDL